MILKKKVVSFLNELQTKTEVKRCMCKDWILYNSENQSYEKLGKMIEQSAVLLAFKKEIANKALREKEK